MKPNLHVVTISTGSYDGNYTTVHRVYSEALLAESFVTTENRKLDKLRVLEKASDLFMAAWETTNPQPQPERPHGTWSGPDIYDHWHDDRCAEQRRVESILCLEAAYKDASLSFSDREANTTHYRVHEVPQF